jgi:hypothetical protein
MTVSNYMQCPSGDCIEAELANVVDFFNPLALPKDAIDLYEELNK